MIPVQRKALAAFATVSALVLAAAPLAGAAPALNPAVATPVVFLLEIAAYFILALMFNPRMQLTTAALVALGAVALRLVACVGGIAIHALVVSPDEFERAHGFLALAFGQPFVVLVQAAFLLLGMANLVSILFPDALSAESLEALGGPGAAAPAAAAAPAMLPGMHLSSPTGSFIQVYSWDELSAIVRKTPGLEGFAVLSNEGLVVWRDLPIRIDLEAMAARLAAGGAACGAVVQEAGLGEARRVALESDQHAVHLASLDGSFTLLLVGRTAASEPEFQSRMGVAVATVREFLRWKYPGLPTRTPSEREFAF